MNSITLKIFALLYLICENANAQNLRELLETAREKVRRLERSGQIKRDYEPYLQSTLKDGGKTQLIIEHNLIVHLRRGIRLHNCWSRFIRLRTGSPPVGNIRMEDISFGGRRRARYSHGYPVLVTVHLRRFRLGVLFRRRRKFGFRYA